MFGEVGAIDRDAYDRYFADLVSAVAIEIRHAERFNSRFRLTDLALSPSPPQSFVYLSVHEELETKLELAPAGPEGLTEHLELQRR